MVKWPELPMLPCASRVFTKYTSFPWYMVVSVVSPLSLILPSAAPATGEPRWLSGSVSYGRKLMCSRLHNFQFLFSLSSGDLWLWGQVKGPKNDQIPVSPITVKLASYSYSFSASSYELHQNVYVGRSHHAEHEWHPFSPRANGLNSRGHRSFRKQGTAHAWRLRLPAESFQNAPYDVPWPDLCRGQKIGSKIHRILRQTEISRSKICRTSRQNKSSKVQDPQDTTAKWNIKIQDLQDLTAKQILKVQDPQDTTAKWNINIEDLQDLTAKQIIKVQDPQDTSAKWNIKIKDLQDLTAKQILKVQDLHDTMAKQSLMIQDPQDTTTKV